MHLRLAVNIRKAHRPKLSVPGFIHDLHTALTNSVVGYSMELRRAGSPIHKLDRHWAKTPADGSEYWKPRIPMHIASVSKLITAIAMTRLLDAKMISYDTPIITYLPTYWQKGANIDKITFRNLMTHTAGFNSGTSQSDFPFMKAQVGAGVSAVGTYHYENMNFGLCRILLSVIDGNIQVGATFDPLTDAVWDSVGCGNDPVVRALRSQAHLCSFTFQGNAGSPSDGRSRL